MNEWLQLFLLHSFICSCFQFLYLFLIYIITYNFTHSVFLDWGIAVASSRIQVIQLFLYFAESLGLLLVIITLGKEIINNSKALTEMIIPTFSGGTFVC